MGKFGTLSCIPSQASYRTGHVYVGRQPPNTLVYSAIVEPKNNRYRKCNQTQQKSSFLQASVQLWLVNTSCTASYHRRSGFRATAELLRACSRTLSDAPSWPHKATAKKMQVSRIRARLLIPCRGFPRFTLADDRFHIGGELRVSMTGPKSGCLLRSSIRAIDSETVRRMGKGAWITATGRTPSSMTNSAPALTRATSAAKLRPASATEMWIAAITEDISYILYRPISSSFRFSSHWRSCSVLAPGALSADCRACISTSRWT